MPRPYPFIFFLTLALAAPAPADINIQSTLTDLRRELGYSMRNRRRSGIRLDQRGRDGQS